MPGRCANEVPNELVADRAIAINKLRILARRWQAWLPFAVNALSIEGEPNGECGVKAPPVGRQGAWESVGSHDDLREENVWCGHLKASSIARARVSMDKWA